MHLCKLLLSLLFLLSLSILSGQGDLPPDFFNTRFSSGFDRSRGLEFDANGKMYVYEQGGAIWTVDTSGVKSTTPFLDLRERVSTWFDHGLLGMCLDNDFLNNGYFYTLYTVDRYWVEQRDQPGYNPDSTLTNTATWGMISRFTADPATGMTTVLEDSEKVLLGETMTTGVPIFYNYHGLGKIKQAEDGTLIISTGDNAKNTDDIGDQEEDTYISEALELGIITPDMHIGSYRSQYLNSLNGKLLRIDAETGNGLPSNPFYNADAPRSASSRIWAMGFRNPYRFTIVPNTGSHDPDSGDPGLIYIGDVGNGSWEEFNVCNQPGMNFGWPFYEGPKSGFSFLNKPSVTNYAAPNPLSDSDCPEYLTFRESYIRLGLDNNTFLTNPCDPTLVFDYPGTAIITPPALTWSNANWNLPARSGTVKIEPGAGISYQSLSAGGSPVSGPEFGGFSSLSGFIVRGEQWPAEMRGKLIFYDYSGWIKLAEVDENGYPVVVEDFIENLNSLHTLTYNPVTNRIFYLVQSHEIREISFGGNPPPEAIGNITPNFGAANLNATFSAAASYDQNAENEDLSYEWDFGDGTTSNDPEGSHNFSTTGNTPRSFRPVLKVTDPEGAVSTDTLLVSLNNTPPQVAITSFQDGDRYPIDKTNLLGLTAEVFDNEHDPESLTYLWEAFIHHNTHFHPEATVSAERSRLLLDPLGCANEDYWYRVQLTVTDPEGLSNSVAQEIFPDCAQQSAIVSELTVQRNLNLTGVEATWMINSPVEGSYELQRSINGFDFSTLSSAMFTPGTTIDFSATDLAPIDGTNHYRIKTITQDRSINFSNVAKLDWPAPIKFSLSPNPADESVSITINEPLADRIFDFKLYNRVGILAYSTTWFNPSTDELILFDIQLPNRLLPGAYFYQITGNEGFSRSGKLMIVRP